MVELLIRRGTSANGEKKQSGKKEEYSHPCEERIKIRVNVCFLQGASKRLLQLASAATGPLGRSGGRLFFLANLVESNL